MFSVFLVLMYFQSAAASYLRSCSRSERRCPPPPPRLWLLSWRSAYTPSSGRTPNTPGTGYPLTTHTAITVIEHNQLLYKQQNNRVYMFFYSSLPSVGEPFLALTPAIMAMDDSRPMARTACPVFCHRKKEMVTSCTVGHDAWELQWICSSLFYLTPVF